MAAAAGFVMGALGVGAGTAFAAAGGAMFGGWVAGAAFGSTLLGAVGVRLLTSVALSALSTALMGKPEGQQAGMRTSSTMTGGTNPEAVILGAFATSGALVCPPMSHGSAGKTPNAYLTYVVELAGAPGHELLDLMIDGEYVEVLTANPHATYGQRIGGRFEGRAWIRYYDGTQTTADAGLLATYPAPHVRPWTPDMVGHGICYAILTFQYDREVYHSWPSTRFVLGGMPLYDPRKDSTAGGSGAQRWDSPATWTATRNAAVMVYNILRGIRLPGGHVWGGEATAEDLPYATWAAAMDVCDQQVDDGAGGTEPQYRAGIEVFAEDEPFAVVDELLSACAGHLTEHGGVWQLRCGAPGMPVLFFSDDDVIITDPQEFDPFPAPDATYNAITASYPDPESLWESRDAEPIYNEDWEAEDGNRRLPVDLPLTAVPWGAQVTRIMSALIRDHRRMRRHIITLPPEAGVVEPGDVIAWTSEANFYSAKLFEIAETVRDPRTGLVQVSLREVDPADYDPPSDLTRPAPPDLRPVRPAPQAVPGWSVEGITLLDANGIARRSAIRASWDPEAADDARGVRVQVRRSGDAASTIELPLSDVAAGEAVFAAAVPGQVYQARGLIVSDRATVWSEWISAVAPGVVAEEAELPDDTPPGVTGLALSSSISAVGVATLSATWNGAAAYFEVELTEAGAPALSFQTGANRYEWTPVAAGTAYTVRVRAVGTLGTKTEWTAPVTHTVAADTTPPGVPAGLTVDPSFESIWVRWTARTEPDMSHYIVQVGSTNYRTESNVFLVTGLGEGVNYSIRVRAVDTSGNQSAWTAAVTARTVSVSERIEQEIADNKWAEELGFVVIHSGPSLPTTNIGATISWNGKLYSWDGSGYATASAISFDEVTGLITGNMVAANTLTGANVRAGSMTASRMAIGDTSNKVLDAEYRDREGYWTLNSNLASFGVAANQSTQYYGQDRVLTIRDIAPGPSGWTRLVASDLMTAQEGREYYASLGFWVDAPGARIIARFGFYDADVLYLGTIALHVGVYPYVSSRWMDASGVAPAGTRYVRAEFFIDRSEVLPAINLGRFLLREKDNGNLLVNGSITSTHLITSEEVLTTSAQIRNAIITNAHINDLSAAKLTAGTALASSITVNGTALSTVRANAALGAQDPAARINNATTNIDPGRITISGPTTLAAWRGLSDTTTINGGMLETRSVKAASLEIGDMTNLVVNGDMMDISVPPTTYFQRNGGTGMSWQTAAQASGTASLQITRATGTETNIITHQNYPIPVREGEEFACEVVQWVNALSSAGSFFRVHWYAGLETINSPIGFSDAWSNESTGAGWQTRTGTVTAPAGAKYARVQVWRNMADTWVTAWRIDRIVMRRAMDTVMIKDGVITGPKLDMGSVLADVADFDQAFINDAHILGKLNARNISLIGSNNGFSAGKDSLNDPSDGMYFGRGADGQFGFSMSRESNAGIPQAMRLTQNEGINILNARFTLTGSAGSQPVTLTTNQTVNLPAGSQTISLLIVGGGGGGNAAGRDGPGSVTGTDGGTTTVRLLNGSTVVQTWTASGGAAGGHVRGGGEDSPLGSGGRAGFLATGGGWYPSPGGAGLRGAGGGGGGNAYRGGRPGFGGAAGETVEVVELDISGLSNPRLEFIRGAGGSGGGANGEAYSMGGAGGPGAVRYRVQAYTETPADVLPLIPTATGSFNKPSDATGANVFPDLGPGMWHIFCNNNDNIDIGVIEITTLAHTVRAVSTNTLTFIANKRPNIITGWGSTRTIHYHFYRMGDWG